jgi:hypothetical protein
METDNRRFSGLGCKLVKQPFVHLSGFSLSICENRRFFQGFEKPMTRGSLISENFQKKKKTRCKLGAYIISNFLKNWIQKLFFKNQVTAQHGL